VGLAGSLKKLNSQIRIEEQKLKNVLAIQKSKDTITADYERLKSYIDIERMPERQIIEELLKEAEKIAKDSGGTVLNLSPQAQIEEAKTYKKYKADLRMEANVEQLLSFFYGLEKSRLLIKIYRMSLSPKDEQATTLKVDMALSMAVPSEQEKQESRKVGK
jgi:hypothetical protein